MSRADPQCERCERRTADVRELELVHGLTLVEKDGTRRGMRLCAACRAFWRVDVAEKIVALVDEHFPAPEATVSPTASTLPPPSTPEDSWGAAVVERMAAAAVRAVAGMTYEEREALHARGAACRRGHPVGACVCAQTNAELRARCPGCLAQAPSACRAGCVYADFRAELLGQLSGEAAVAEVLATVEPPEGT